MATFASDLSRVVSTDVLPASALSPGQFRVNATTGDVDFVAQSPTTGAPVVVNLSSTAAVAGGAWEYVFLASGIQDPDTHLYSNWADLIAALALLPPGAQPVVVVGESATIPVGVWDVRNATFVSRSLATGSEILTLADGGVIDNLAGVNKGLVLSCLHSGAGSALTFSQWLPGSLRVLQIGLGGAIRPDGTAPLIKTPNFNGTFVVALLAANFFAGVPPTSTLIDCAPSDTVIGFQGLASGPIGSFPDQWIEGQGALEYISGLTALVPSTPAFVGTVTTSLQVEAPAARIAYAPAVPADWVGPAPATVSAALDRIASLLAVLSGGPIP